VGAATSHEYSFSLDPPAAEPVGTPTSPSDAGTYRPVPTSVWVGVGVTGALTVGAAVTGVLALGRNNAYESANTAGDPDASDLRQQVKTMNLVTDVLIGGAVVAGAVSTVL